MSRLQALFDEEAQRLYSSLEKRRFLGDIAPFSFEKSPQITCSEVHAPSEDYRFLHESAIISFKGTLYASWYNCQTLELFGRTPIRGRRSKDGGKTWTEVETVLDNGGEDILYCPPVYGISEGKLYMLVNEMISADFIHALDLLVLNEETDRFELLWSKPIPFKLNTNVYSLPNGKLMLPGRIAEMDSFPNTPAVLISDSGKIDGEWRLVKIAPDGKLPNGQEYEHPELAAIIDGNKVYVFARNDANNVPLGYLSEDCGESWSKVFAYDIPFCNSKIYSGTLSNGRNYIIGNILPVNLEAPQRGNLAIFFTEPESMVFNKGFLLQTPVPWGIYNGKQWSYPVATEQDGKLYVIYSGIASEDEQTRGALLSIVPIDI